ncbi:MAG: HlyD family secretion protein [Hyphomicrobium sp.]
MIEILLCSLFTVVPDFLYRRYAQDKRIGREITLYSVWYELRWGITACIMLAIALITVIFYNHPTSTNVTAYFRTVPIVPETNGRVAEVYVGLSGDVAAGAPIFKLDTSKQKAAIESSLRRIEEIDAQMTVARSDIAVAGGQIQQAKGAYQEAVDELRTKEELNLLNANIVAAREIERLKNIVEGRQGAVAAAEAAKQGAETRLSTLLPAQKASAEATKAEAEVDLGKSTVYAGVDGRIEQFSLRVGDVVNPFMRPAGVLIPKGAGRKALVAGFGQIEAQVIKVGMTAEATCLSKPWTVIPMVVTQVQDYIAAGQVRASEQLIDAQQVTRPGAITTFLEPMYEGGLEGVAPGSSCIANAYTSNHERLKDENVGIGSWLYMHMVDAVSIVHAAILRLQALVLPIKILVFSGH